jgi:hypothetical protein
VAPVWYELGFYIPEDGILHSHCRENLTSYIASVCLPYMLAGETKLRVSHQLNGANAELGTILAISSYLPKRRL